MLFCVSDPFIFSRKIIAADICFLNEISVFYDLPDCFCQHEDLEKYILFDNCLCMKNYFSEKISMHRSQLSLSPVSIRCFLFRVTFSSELSSATFTEKISCSSAHYFTMFFFSNQHHFLFVKVAVTLKPAFVMQI